MKLSEILRLPNLTPYSHLETKIIDQFFSDFPYVVYRFGDETYSPGAAEPVRFIRQGVLGLSVSGHRKTSSTIVVKLSEGKGFFGGDRTRYHLFESFGSESGDHDDLGVWKGLARLLVKIGNADHYPRYPGGG